MIPRVFIGYDSQEAVTYHVLAHSIMRHASVPVSITPIFLSQTPLKRPRDAKQSTEFAFSRFLVPWLCDFKGRAIFMDCDMLCLADVAELWALGDGKQVSVVKHDYMPKAGSKFLGNPQTTYERKNWSSVTVFDCERCTSLTPALVDKAPGLFLHQFGWVNDEADIGELPAEWNHLVGEFAPNPAAKLAHFTLGSPCFRRYQSCEFSEEWHAERDAMISYNRYGECQERAA